MKFELAITLGNAAMQSPADIAHALADVAERITGQWDGDGPHAVSGRIRDLNGNSVGYWRVTT